MPSRLARAGLGVFARQGDALAPWLAVALGVGILGYFALLEEPSPAWRWLVLPLVTAALAAARWHPLAGWSLGLIAAAALGFAAASWHGEHAAPALDLPRNAVIVTGIVQSVEMLPEGRRVALAQARIGQEAALPRLVRVRLRANDPARPEPGDTLTLRTLLRPPPPPAYPGAWDFQRGAWFSGLGASGSALGPASVEPGSGAAPPLAATRTAIEARVTSLIPGAAGTVAAALLTGSQGAIPAPAMQAMRDSGLAHLLSVSGLHIAIVMGCAFTVLRFLIAAIPALALRGDGRRWPALGALVAGGAYLVLTAFQVPMQRSFAMAALVTLGLVLGRRALSPRVLAFAAAVVMLVQPESLTGPSFQMSFAAVLALIAGFEALRPWLPRRQAGQGVVRAALRWLALALLALLLTSLLAGAATTPFGLHHFGRVQLYGMAANALAVPLTSVLVMPAGMLALALMPLGLDTLPLAAMGWGAQLTLDIAEAVAAWPGAAVPMRPIPAEGLAIASFGFLLLCLWRGAGRLVGVPIIAAGLSAGLVIRPPDILVSADARVILVRTEAGTFLQRLSGGSNFTRDAFLRAAGRTVAEPILPNSNDPGLRCTGDICRVTPQPGGTDAVLVRMGESGSYCGTAAVLVSAEPVRPRCRASQVVDRFSVWRDGAHAIWLSPEGAVVLSDRAQRGRRPWVPPPPAPRVLDAQLPPLPTE
nr:ComEC/Rec2 family competence protein [Plastoroseomonas arctica]